MVWQSVVIMSLWLKNSFDDIRWVFTSSRWSNIQSVEIFLFDTKYMIQIHYDNVRTNEKRLDHRDHSGIRFYLGDELRQYDLGYLTLDTESNPGAITIPPHVDHVIIDVSCPSKATEDTKKMMNRNFFFLCLQW